jgi:alkylation response protein AidB-like acyl-CoA dehydrogenase
VNFDFSDDQQVIGQTAKELLAIRFRPERVRTLAEKGEYADDVWAELCDLGWPGIFIDENFGGQGLGIVELVILQEALGYVVAPLPFLSNAAAGLMIQHAGSDRQRERWLPGIASGEVRGTVGLVGRDGEAKLVPDGATAEVIVLAAQDGAVVVDRAEADIAPLKTMDHTRRFARVRSQGGEMLTGDVAAGLDRVATAVAAELVGVAQRALDMATDYARNRKQFGRAIGAYQGVSHCLAQMLLETQGARSATYYAAWAADAEPDTLALAASMAKAYASDAGGRVTSSALQVHGGIGFTWEHDVHFLLKRAKTDGLLYGSARERRETVAALSGLEVPNRPATLRLTSPSRSAR